MNYCTACHKDFGSVGAFDDHRVGKHAYTITEGLKMDPPREDGRRCLSVLEMTEMEWHHDKFGRWRTPWSSQDASVRMTHSWRRAARARTKKT